MIILWNLHSGTKLSGWLRHCLLQSAKTCGRKYFYISGFQPMGILSDRALLCRAPTVEYLSVPQSPFEKFVWFPPVQGKLTEMSINLINLTVFCVKLLLKCKSSKTFQSKIVGGNAEKKIRWMALLNIAWERSLFSKRTGILVVSCCAIFMFLPLLLRLFKFIVLLRQMLIICRL